MLKVCVIGTFGVDVSSPSSKVARGEHIESINVRDLLVSHVRAQTPIGKRIQRYFDTKKLLPDEFTAGIVADRLATVDDSWILINYPQTPAQAQLLADRGHDPTLVIEFALTEEETLDRFGWGQLCPDCAQQWRAYFHAPDDPTVCRECGNPLAQPPDPQRRDDILARFAMHRERTDLLAAHYEATGRFLTLDAVGDTDHVAAKLKAALQQGSLGVGQ